MLACVCACVREAGQRKFSVNITDYSRSDVCCYSSLVDNGMLCNDKGETTAISDLLLCEKQTANEKLNHFLEDFQVAY